MSVSKYPMYSAFYDILNDDKASFDFEKQQILECINEIDNPFEDKNVFRGKIITPPVQIVESQGSIQSAGTGAKKIFVAKSRLDDIEDNILTPEGKIIDPSLKKQFQTMHKTAIFAPSDGQNIVQVNPGDEVEFGFSIDGPNNNGKLRGLEYTDNVTSRASGNYSYTQSSSNVFQSSTQIPTTIGDAMPIPPSNYRPPKKRIYRGQFGAFEIYNGILREGLLVTSRASLYGTKLLADIVPDFEGLAAAFYEANLTKERKIQASSFRTYQGQIDIYEDPTKIKKRTKADGTEYEDHLGAYPGTSKHGWGVAIDINTRDKNGIRGFNSNVYKWMLQNAGRFNFHSPNWARINGSKPESWHFEHGTIDSKFIVSHKFIFKK